MGDITIYLNDRMVNFKKPVKVMQDGKLIAEKIPSYDLGVLVKTACARMDPELVFTDKIQINIETEEK
ncbi:hypothetical protein ACFL54_01125 [Planctomycetota bacterium]